MITETKLSFFLTKQIQIESSKNISLRVRGKKLGNLAQKFTISKKYLLHE